MHRLTNEQLQEQLVLTIQTASHKMGNIGAIASAALRAEQDTFNKHELMKQALKRILDITLEHREVIARPEVLELKGKAA